MKHFISMRDIPHDTLMKNLIPGCVDWVPIVATIQKGEFGPKYDRIKLLALDFYEASTRTKESTKTAGYYNGFLPLEISDTGSSLQKGESFANTARMRVIQGASVLAMRTKIEGLPRFISEIFDTEGYPVSVINCGDGTNQHPTQTLLDLLTILMVLGRLDNFKIGFFGDLKYGRTVHGLITALAKISGVEIYLYSDPEVQLQDQYRDLCVQIYDVNGFEGFRNCDIIYGSRLQKERFQGNPMGLKRAEQKFVIDEDILALFKKGVKIMHPMPYEREFSPSIRKDPAIIIDDQASYGVVARTFLIQELYKHRNESGSAREQLIINKVLRDENKDDYLSKQQERKKDWHYFRPINNGLVIDKIRVREAENILDYLEKNKIISSKQPYHLIRNIDSEKMGKKDVIVIEGYHPSDADIANIGALHKDAVFNIVESERFRKIQHKQTNFASNIGKCPNEHCVTNIEEECGRRFIPLQNGRILCDYCEKEFEINEVIIK